MERNTFFFVICLCTVILLKFMPLPEWRASVEEHHESDLRFYETMAQSFLGYPVEETPRFYQYPPLYTLLILPGVLCDDLFLYVLVMDAVFAVLVFVTLVFFARRYMREPLATFTSLVISVSSIFLLPLKSFGYPFMFMTLLFILFLYFFERKRWVSSVVFMVLVATSYVSLFLVPFILLMLFLEKTSWRRFLCDSFLFLLPAGLVFCGWSLRNVLIHGVSATGAVGSYSTLSANLFRNIPDRLLSFFIYYEPFMILIYSLVFLAGFVIVFWRKQKEMYLLYTGMMFNLVFFLFVPGMSWELEYLAWRYICFMMPCYLVLGVAPWIPKANRSC